MELKLSIFDSKFNEFKDNLKDLEDDVTENESEQA
jgi:hypothetical protein